MVRSQPSTDGVYSHERFPFRAKAFLSDGLAIPISDIKDGFSRETCPDWDSFAHLNLMLELEKSYSVQLTDETIRRYASLKDIAELFENTAKARSAA